MRIVLKIAAKITASLLSWLVAVIIVDAGVEHYYTQPRPDLVSLITLLAMFPILFVIWRR